MEQLGIGEFSKAVIGMGNNLEASVLTAFVLRKLGVADIWAKAITTSQSEILSKVGVSHVARPEHEMGERVAHLVRGRMRDYIEFDDGYAIATHRPTTEHRRAHARRCGGARSLRRHGHRHHVARTGRHAPQAQARLNQGDLVIVTGERRNVELFADQQ